MEHVWRINLMGAFMCMRRELLMMESQGRGAIVNVASMAAQPVERVVAGSI